MAADESLGAAFPSVDEDWLDTAVFRLSYHLHGGSGLNLSGDYIENLDVSRVTWFLNRLHEQRKAEAESLKKPTS